MNNNKQNGSNTYREQQILTASPARLVAMLYGKAITCLRQAIKAIEDGEIQARYNAVARTVEIIEHLSMTLDTDQGGQIAADLDRLYPFMIKHLIDVNVKNDPKPARDVIALLKPLYESWCGLDRRMAQGELTAAPKIVTNPAAPKVVTDPAAPKVVTDPAAPGIEGPPGGRISASA